MQEVVVFPFGYRACVAVARGAQTEMGYSDFERRAGRGKER